jgi:stearoyl-CoA desaturase (delta-9 desaturase)
MKTRLQIFSLQMLAYLSIIPMILYASWHEWIIALFMYFVFNGLGMIMTYHRLLTHRSYDCPKWLEYTLSFITTFSFTGSAITWIAIHRKHHKFADTDKDPHSPDHLGFWRVQFFTAFAEVEGRYALDLMRDSFYKWQHKYYTIICYVTILTLALIDPMLVVYALLFPAGLTLFFGTLILSTAHKDFKPRTVLWLALVTFGDAFHDVHHDYPNKYRLHKLDLIGWIIEKVFIRNKTTPVV